MTKTFKITTIILIITALMAVVLSLMTRETRKLVAQPVIEEEQKESTKEEPSEEVEELKAEDIDTSNWKTYRNEEYGFSFRYPVETEVMSDGYADSPSQSASVSVYPKILDIEVQDPEQWQSSPETIEIINLGLKEFTEKKWQLNKEDKNPNIKNKKVGDIEKSIIDDRKSYQFILTGNYHDESGGYLLDEENLYIFTDNKNGLKYIIWLPSHNKISKAILETFRFLN